MINTYNQNEYDRFVMEIEGDYFDNLLDRYPDFVDDVEGYANGEINKKNLLKRVKNKLSDNLRYGQFDMIEEKSYKFEFEQQDLEFGDIAGKKSNDDQSEISPYALMKRYQSGDEKALDDLFQWDYLKNKVKFSVPALEHMLKRCIHTNKSNGLENVGVVCPWKSAENTDRKCNGWIKRYVQPVEPEYIEGLFLQTLLEILKNKPSECPEDLRTIKKFEEKGITCYDVNVDGLSVIKTTKFIIFNEDIKSDSEIRKELKRRMEKILSQTFTHTESRTEYIGNTKTDGLDYDFDIEMDDDENKDIQKSKKPKKYLISKKETPDIITTHTSDDDEYSLYLSDRQVAKNYMTTQLSMGYQDIYAYILANIRDSKFSELEYFTSVQRKYIDFFLNCEGKYFKLNENNHYIIDLDAVAENFNCTKGNVSQIIVGIADKILKFLDLDIDFKYEEVVSGKPRVLVRKSHINKRHLTFKTLNMFLEKEKIMGAGMKKRGFNDREDIICLADAPLFKEIIRGETDDNIESLFKTMYFGDYPNTIADIFDVYFDQLLPGDVAIEDRKRRKDLFLDAMGEGKLSTTFHEAYDLYFNIYTCIYMYIQESYKAVSQDKIFNYDRYNNLGYRGIITGDCYHDEQLERQTIKLISKYFTYYESNEWTYYWMLSENILYLYKWLREDCMFPIRYDRLDVKKSEYKLSDNWEILYGDFDPYQSQYLVDHGNKMYFRLSHRNRVYTNSRKLYLFRKTV